MKRFFIVIASLSLLAGMAACDKTAKSTANPFFEEEWDTPYGAPPFDRIEVAHFKPAFEQGMALHAEEIARIVESDEEPAFENVILAYDNAGQMLNRVSAVFSLLEAADTSDEIQAISAEMMPQLAAHSDVIMMNDALFAKIKAVYDRRGALGLDREQLRLTEQIYDRFVRSGALLSEADKARLTQINGELTSLSVQFAANLLAETNAFALEVPASRLDGIPQAVRDAAKEQAEQMGKKGYVFTLHSPSRLPLLTYADDRALREEVYKAYISRGDNGNENDNNDIIASIASLRYEKAKLLGYASYAHYVTSQQMAGSPQAAYELLEGVWQPALATAQIELARMNNIFRRDHDNEEKFAAWDWWYYAEKVRQRDYQLDENKVREYLSLENVKGGVFFLANRLFGITLRPITAPFYNEECEAYEVIDNNDKPLGMIYFDFHPRAGKGGGAWFGNYVSQAFKDGQRVCPVGTIVCNFTRPTDSTPALLSLDEVKTLFHEFGHALHVMFAQVKYRGLSEVEGDFVELPSQILENWALSREMLKQYAIHYRTGDVMPDSMIDKIHRAAKFNEGFATTELVAAALADLDIHSLQSADKINVAEFQQKALFEKRGLIPQIEPRYRYTYFQHIFNGGYSSGYYFYTWAEVLDKDAFEAFVESGDIFNTEIAARFREEILSRGGTRAGMDMYRAFRGADPDKDALLRARGFIEDNRALLPVEDATKGENIRVDTREQARQRAAQSRREREAAAAEERAAEQAVSSTEEQTVSSTEEQAEASTLTQTTEQAADVEGVEKASEKELAADKKLELQVADQRVADEKVADQKALEMVAMEEKIVEKASVEDPQKE